MAKNRIQDGTTVRFTAAKALKSGDVVVIGDLIAITLSDVENKAEGIGATEGVFNVKAKQADDIAQGAVLYWSDTDGATTTAGSNKRLGIAWQPSGTQATTVDVKINA